MVKVSATDRAGITREIEGQAGTSLMEAIRDAGVDEAFALCGSCCSCATCHDHFGNSWLNRLTPMSGDEDDLLDGLDQRTANSRQWRQVLPSSKLAGHTVTIAQEG
jgi:2Fe-2S ferredoxin